MYELLFYSFELSITCGILCSLQHSFTVYFLVSLDFGGDAVDCNEEYPTQVHSM